MLTARISNDDNNNKRKATDVPEGLNSWIKKANTAPSDIKQDIFQKYRQDRQAATNKAVANSVYAQIKPYQPTGATFGLPKTLTSPPPIPPPVAPPIVRPPPILQRPQIPPTKFQPNSRPTQAKPPINYNANNNNHSNLLKLAPILTNTKKFDAPAPVPEPVTEPANSKKQKTKETSKQPDDEDEPADEYLSMEDDEDEDPKEFNGSKVIASVSLDEIETETKFYGDDDDEVSDDDVEVIPTTTEEEDDTIMNEAEMRRQKFHSVNNNSKKKMDRYDPYKELIATENLKLNEEDKPFATLIKKRREEELKRYSEDNYYDFSEFTSFSNPTEDEECLDWDNSRELIFYVAACSWKYSEKYGTVLEYKGNMDGMSTSPSCTILTTGFKSNFYIQPPAHWTDEHMKKFMNVLNHVVRNLYKWRNGKDRRIIEKISHLFVKYEAVTTEAINGYTKDDGRKMYKIYCLYPKAVAAARKILNKPWKYDWAYSRETIRVFDADVDFTQRYFYDTGTEPCRWFRIPAHEYEVIPTWSRARSSRSKVEIVCKNEFMSMIPKDNEEYKNKVPQLLVMSYDTEQCNEPFKFPAPRVFPMIVKTMNISRYPNFNDSKNVLMVYAHNGELPAELQEVKDDPTAASKVLPGVDYFYWFKSEPGLMEHFRRFVIHKDIDTIVDYNGGSYDWSRIYENGSMYFGEPYRIFGRDLYKKSWIDRNEWRSRTDYSVNVDGRWCIDMVKRTRAEAPFWPNPPPDFSLNSVCLNYLGETKEEFDVNLMKSKWMNKNTVIQIWRYGKKDAELPAKLCNKMNTISTFISMAQMTNLTFQKALDSGTGRKIEGFLRKLGMDRPIPLLFECLAKDNSNMRNLTNACARDVEGAQVIEPKKGYYEQYIAIFDFSSMYPSIMRLLNTCLRTYLQKGLKEHLGLNPEDFWSLPRYDYDPAANKIYMVEDYEGHTFVKSHVKMGLMPEAQEKLGQWRKDVRAEMDRIKEQVIPAMLKELATLKADTTLAPREKEERVAKLEEDIRVQRFNIVNMEGFQNAIKILMNGMFGQTIFAAGKLYCKAIGETVLTFGRYMINYVRSFINTTFCIANGAGVDLDVIYGDTDSVMVALMKALVAMSYQDVLKTFRAVKIAINGNFSGPVEMNLENITHGFLLQGKKNYAAGKLKKMDSDYKGTPEERSLIMKGFRFKKKGTSPLAARAGKFITDTAVLKRDKETAFQYVRDIIVSLKRRQVTRSDLIVRANFGRDITAALYNYMVQCRQQGNPPPKATEEAISKRFFALSETEREGSSSATPAIVYAYRAMCKDPAQWFERGNTIYFIYAEGNSGTKGNLVCSVADAINMDIPYNVDVYIQEVLKITKKVLAKMVGDMDNEKTPNFDSMTINHPSVKVVSNGQHISFFDSRFGAKDYSIMQKAKLTEDVKELIGTSNPRFTVELNKDEEGTPDGTAIVSEKTLGIMTDIEMCNNAVIRLIDNSASSGENIFTVERINRYYTYTYNKCSMCKSDINIVNQFGTDPKEKSLTLCDDCLNDYGKVKFNCDMKMNEMKKKVNQAWDKCANCLQADPTQALDCVSYSCDHYTKRMDVTLQYYQEYVKTKGIRDIEDVVSSKYHEIYDDGEVLVHGLRVDKDKVEKMKAARERREQRKKKKLEELSQSSQSNDSI